MNQCPNRIQRWVRMHRIGLKRELGVIATTAFEGSTHRGVKIGKYDIPSLATLLDHPAGICSVHYAVVRKVSPACSRAHHQSWVG